ncbi:hypothetical protein CPB83DRAFT_675368 [Crepidotus variabilis]|uniref:Uncharacterized protein n=1 Tax=Crepidotus variabilis TaxID=179855 RepID=A0A9P6ENU7_9AGAR|nr:hypothetical protein CPB83DRAFT_675368 [Crepidotus variabilis]
MSAMIETYDAQMLDYNPDIDMHMHASASDPWLHEVQMEEDHPGLKNLGQGEDITIEIDMDEQSTEYDMVDDEQVQNAPSPQIIDVEVYDASLAQSPAMATVDSPLPTETHLILPIEPTPHVESSLAQVYTATEPRQPSPTLPSVVENPPSSDGAQGVPAPSELREEQPTQMESGSNLVVVHESSSVETLPPSSSYSQFHDEQLFPTQPSKATSTASDQHSDQQPLVEDSVDAEQHFLSAPQSKTTREGPSDTDNGVEVPQTITENTEDEVEANAHVNATSTDDPHEISEGVYIDPPPPVLLSTSSEDLQFQHAFFNAPIEWHSATDSNSHHVILHHLPTLYYEPLSSLFEALRQEAFIQTLFQSTDTELMLEALDLTLTLSEDNIYAREVSLHDLNMLHDASGISGPLRIRLYVNSPRFIVRYHQLQEHVSRLQVDPAYRESSISAQAESSEPVTVLAANSEREAASPESHTYTTGPNDVPSLEDAQTDENEEPVEVPVPEARREEADEVGKILAHKEEELSSKVEKTAFGERHQGDELADQTGNSDEDEQAYQPLYDEEDSTTTADSYSEHHDEDRQSEHEEDVIRLEQAEADPSEEQEAVQNEVQADEEDLSADVDTTQPPQAADIEGEVLEEVAGVTAENQMQPTVDQESLSDDHISEQQAEDAGECSSNGREFGQGNDDINQNPNFQPSTSEPQNSLPFEDADADAEGDPDTNDFFEEGETSEPLQQTAEEDPIPELPTEPIAFDDDNEDWDGEFDVVGDDTVWNGEEDKDGDVDNDLATSNHSSVTLSSRTSKRTFDEYESGGEGFEEVGVQQLERLESPGNVRLSRQIVYSDIVYVF